MSSLALNPMQKLVASIPLLPVMLMDLFSFVLAWGPTACFNVQDSLQVYTVIL